MYVVQKKKITKTTLNFFPASFFGRLFKRLFKLTLLISISLAVLYWLDVERFRQVQASASRALDAGIALLPPQTFVYLNNTSTFLNTDPRVKDHWANLRDVAIIARDRASDAIAALMVATPVYVNDVKLFVLKALNSTKT